MRLSYRLLKSLLPVRVHLPLQLGDLSRHGGQVICLPYRQFLA